MNPYYPPFQQRLPIQMPYKSVGYPTKTSSGNTMYIIISVISVISVIFLIIIGLVIVFYFKSKSGVGNNQPGVGNNQPKENLNICDSRLNNGICPEILNNLNGKLCFAKFDTNTGSYTLVDPDGKRVWDNGYNGPKKEDSPPYTLNISQNGHLIVKDSKNSVVWETKMDGVAPFALKLQDNCNLELYDSQINKLWESGTSGKNN